MTTVAKKSAADTVKQKKSGVLGRLWRAHKLDPQEQSVGHGDEEEQHGASGKRLQRASVAAWPRAARGALSHAFNREDNPLRFTGTTTGTSTKHRMQGCMAPRCTALVSLGARRPVKHRVPRLSPTYTGAGTGR